MLSVWFFTLIFRKSDYMCRRTIVQNRFWTNVCRLLHKRWEKGSASRLNNSLDWWGKAHFFYAYAKEVLLWLFQMIFHCEIVVDAKKVKREEKACKKIPVITDFTDGDGNDRMKETVQANYRRIKEEVKQIVQEEMERIANDENLKHLLQQKG